MYTIFLWNQIQDLNHDLWSSYFPKTRFRTKTTMCGYRLNSDLAGNDIYWTHSATTRFLQTPYFHNWNLKIQSFHTLLGKIPQTGNTQPFRTCVIQEHWFYTMSLNQTISVANTMSPCLYHESMSLQWVHIHESLPKTKSFLIPWVQKFKLQKYKKIQRKLQRNF